MRRKIACLLMIGFCPSSLLAGDFQASMVYARGTVWVNGHPMPASTAAVFAGDSVETKAESSANINASGSSIVLQPNSLVKLDTGWIILQRGGMSVVTLSRMSVRAGEVSAIPSSDVETEFEVSDINGRVQIVAHRKEVNVGCGSESARIGEGQEITRDESGHCKKRAGAIAPVNGNPLENRWLWGGLLTGGGLCAWLCPGGGPPPPISPWHP
jgi:hypothetical protein